MIPNGDLSFQMFSSRAADSLEEQLKLLSELGYTDVQPFFFGAPDDMGALDTYVALLAKYNLTAKTGHFTLDVFEQSPDLVEEIARKFGMWLVVVPYINPEDRPDTAAGWQAIGAKLAEYTADMKSRGLTFAYHNHEFEMVPLADGSYPIDHLLGDTVPFEPDLAWIVVGGADPLVWLEKYTGRIPAIHVKDIAPQGECLDEKGFADLGHGTLDWQVLWDAGVAAGSQIMVVEHDQPLDWKRFATRSIKTLKALGGA
ncbi:Xylose isomerase-like TIM barrel [Aquimixticola soesokkakensis]|uniref:Xylose isomerase-like TIM barrel n=1 Tax=Aquimixticola soesokkakensis TaxID=1519096 RepID=A0A1Y5T5X3_9RHOB|nr:sugar phosphate isomerase/epimerase [Aquimixticola soesokkakensis]SLN56512.1 Xylose isomerase-like TIM barrel [Aquimixticola soesokkakensis]